MLDSLWAGIQIQHRKWLTDDALAYHLTIMADGWSNFRMESIYIINIVFPDRQAIMLKAEDLSSEVHSGETIAG